MNQAIIIYHVYINASIISNVTFETASDFLSVYSNATSHYYEVLQAMAVLMIRVHSKTQRGGGT
jgi:hypothetical protein